MAKKRKLKWGETPWDVMSNAELQRECQRMALALQAAGGVIETYRMQCLAQVAGIDWSQPTAKISKALEAAAEKEPFWSKCGRGECTLEMMRQALHSLERVDSESFYRAFSRYAHDLLFDESVCRIGFGWVVCSACGVMLGRGSEGENRHDGQACSMGKKDCVGIMRKLQWSDLEPKAKAK